MSIAIEVRYTPEQYLALERPALERSEYFDGIIRLMARSNHFHSHIKGNVLVALAEQCLRRPVDVYASAMRTRIGPAGPYTYPDVVAVAGEPLFEDAEEDNPLNPTLIVEVFSPKTEAFDRGEKFASYRRSESLREYILVAQDRVLVEHYTRRGEDWPLTAFTRSIACEIPLRQVYAKTPLAGQG